jgi:hypothetical protein
MTTRETNDRLLIMPSFGPLWVSAFAEMT